MDGQCVDAFCCSLRLVFRGMSVSNTELILVDDDDELVPRLRMLVNEDFVLY